jgi:hypothetical protein
VLIPAQPGDVCLTHAIDFWTGLLAFVKARSVEFQNPEWPAELDVMSAEVSSDAASV